MATQSKYRFVLKWLVAVAAVAGGAFFLFAGASRFPELTDSPMEDSNVPEPPRVCVLEMTPHPVSETVTLPGVAHPIQDIDLAATVPGTVEWVGVSEGDFVRVGQPLFRIDQRARQARVQDASAAYVLAFKNLERIRTVYESGIVSVDEFDKAYTQFRRAEASLNLAQTELDLSLIKAPISGFVDRIDTDEGEYAHEGQLLAHLVDISTVKVTVGTPERDVEAVCRQVTASVYIEALQRSFTGRIGHVAYAADPRTNTFETHILIDNPDRRIRAGMVARATVVTAYYDQALSVPLFSVVQTLQGPVVFVEEGGIVHSVPVTLGGINGDKVTVLEGLEPGDRVVVIGQRDLADGQRVQVVSPSDPGVVIPVL